jgi:hypothetical protein
MKRVRRFAPAAQDEGAATEDEVAFCAGHRRAAQHQSPPW